MDKSERYLKEIAKNTADIAKELKRMNRDTPTINIHPNTDENGKIIGPDGIEVGKITADIFHRAELDNKLKF